MHLPAPARALSRLMIALVALCLGLIVPVTATLAEQRPLIVTHDRGGILDDRLSYLRSLRAARTPIEIRGPVCYSTCTLYLGMPNVCVSQNVTFGFHGPSSYGAALPPRIFENASRTIASHYPEPLRSWYLNEGRYLINGLHYLQGADLIRMGMRSC